ncbi:hypothetical protein WA158_007072 [Blastocystis sp. Blastoise]
MAGSMVAKSMAIRTIPALYQSISFFHLFFIRIDVRCFSETVNASAKTVVNQNNNSVSSAKISNATDEQKKIMETQKIIMDNVNKITESTIHNLDDLPKNNKNRYDFLFPESKTCKYSSKIINGTGHICTLTAHYCMHPKEAGPMISKGWKATKNGLHHIWISTKLLGKEMATGTKLGYKMALGGMLSRREKKQLTRAVGDTLRMIPFSVFIIVPFMEFTLPFFLTFFPNMLPSTFESETSKETKMQKSLETRLSLATVFQDAIEQMAKTKLEDGKDRDSAESLLTAIQEARDGQLKSTTEIVELSKLFSNDITIDNMPRTQLVTLCRFMGVATYGPEEYLRVQLRSKIKYLITDDLEIFYEGLDDLTVSELRTACQERGMMSTKLNKAGYYNQMKEWLNLSVNEKVPITLLLLSNAMSITSRQNNMIENLSSSISSLSDSTVKEAIIEAAPSDDKLAKAIKYQVIKEEEKKIKEEQVIQTIIDNNDQSEESAIPSDSVTSTSSETINPESIAIETHTENGEKATLSIKELETLKAMASKSYVVNERETLEELKKEIKETAQETKEEEVEKPEIVDKAINYLNKMLKNIEVDLNHLDHQIGDSKKILDYDNDGNIHKYELGVALLKGLKETRSEEEAKSIITKMDKDGDGLISINQLEEILNKAYEKEEPVPSIEEKQEEILEDNEERGKKILL